MAKKASKKSTSKKTTAAKKSEKTIKQLNETGRRKKDGRRTQDQPVGVERRKAPRRRQIDPTTCEREYDNAEIDFMQAMDEYKRASGRMFPTCSEILEVLIKMGYRKVAEPQELYSAEKVANKEETIEEELV